jgi:hypothetical protein
MPSVAAEYIRARVFMPSAAAECIVARVLPGCRCRLQRCTCFDVVGNCRRHRGTCFTEVADAEGSVACDLMSSADADNIYADNLTTSAEKYQGRCYFGIVFEQRQITIKNPFSIT